MTDFEEWISADESEHEAPIPDNPVDRDLWIDSRLRALAAIQRKIDHNEAVADRQIEKINEWLHSVNRPLNSQAEYLRHLLEHEAMVRYIEHGQKTVSLPGGKIGGRARPATVEIVDADKALEFAKSSELLKDKVRVTERINVTSLREYMQATGEIPPGCELVPATVRYYVTPTVEDNDD